MGEVVTAATGTNPVAPTTAAVDAGGGMAAAPVTGPSAVAVAAAAAAGAFTLTGAAVPQRSTLSQRSQAAPQTAACLLLPSSTDAPVHHKKTPYSKSIHCIVCTGLVCS